MKIKVIFLITIISILVPHLSVAQYSKIFSVNSKSKLKNAQEFAREKEDVLYEFIKEYKENVPLYVKLWERNSKYYDLSDISKYKFYLKEHFFCELLDVLNNYFKADISIDFTEDEVGSIRNDGIGGLANIILQKADNLESKYKTHIREYYR